MVVSGNEFMVDVQGDLANGIYCVKFYSGNSVETKLLLIEY